MIHNFTTHEGLTIPPESASIRIGLPYFNGRYGDLPPPAVWLSQSETYLGDTALEVAQAVSAPGHTPHYPTSPYHEVVLSAVSEKLQTPGDTHQHPPLGYPEVMMLSDAVLAFPTEANPDITQATIRGLSRALRVIGNPSILNSALARSVTYAPDQVSTDFNIDEVVAGSPGMPYGITTAPTTCQVRGNHFRISLVRCANLRQPARQTA